jgi:type II secretory pathway predicted ATPase ExeA
VYLKHFGFKRKPFDPTPDSRELFQAEGHQEVRARLQIALAEHLPMLVWGDVGVGKSTSVRSALADVNQRAHRIIEIPEPRLKLRGFYRTLAQGLGLEPRFFFGDLSEQVRAVLAQTAKKNGRHPILVVDDAQMLGPETLETLRLLTNPLLKQNKPGLTLLLVGDMTLGRRLALPANESFLQRLRMTYRMPPVSDEEGRRYVAHRLRTAGGNPDVFLPDAVEEILADANGRLRKIDELAVQALYGAFIAKATAVTKDHVEVARAERSLTA